MDPTTTLITFMLHTSPSVRSVFLVGSWDNFTRHYAMEKDSRRARGQWRGCYTFDNIIYDGSSSGSPIRNGGLKMGHTYWYYYKVDGDIETFDTTLPSTTACPMLPGQPVNFLSIPVEEVPKRDRSASVGCESEPLKTMNPDAKYETPRPPPPPPKLARLNTSTGYECNLRVRLTRSESPKSSRSPWSPRNFFGPKTPVSASPFSTSFQDRGRSTRGGDANISDPVLISRTDEGRKCVRLQYMQEKRGASPSKQHLKRDNSVPKLDLAAVEADDDDDANFARRSLQRQHRDTQLQPTILSPPPKRLHSAGSYEHTPTLRLLTATCEDETDTNSKPLPSIPSSDRELSSSASSYSSISRLAPVPLRLTPPTSMRTQRTDLQLPTITSHWSPRSHFSMDSLDEIVQELSEEENKNNLLLENAEFDMLFSGMISPTDSQFSTGPTSPSSLAESYDIDDEEVVPSDFALINPGSPRRKPDLRSNLKHQTSSISPTQSEFQYNPIISEVSSRGFQEYSLPDSADYASQITLKRVVTVVGDEVTTQIRSPRATFGGPAITSVEEGSLLADLEYLRGVISS